MSHPPLTSPRMERAFSEQPRVDETEFMDATGTNSAPDFTFIDWEALNAEAEANDVYAAGRMVRTWEQGEPNITRRSALAFLANVLMLRMPWGREPGKSPLPEQIFVALPYESAKALASQLPRMRSDLLAHVVDFAWSKRRACSHSAVRDAVAAYIEGAKKKRGPSHWATSFARLQRAVFLAASLGRQGDLFQEAIGAVQAAIRAVNATEGGDSSYISARLMELLLEHDEGDSNEYGRLARRLAEEASAADHDRATTYLEVATRWHQRGGQFDDAQACRKRIIEVLQSAAAKADAALACHLLSQAIEASRQLPDNQARTDELRIELQHRQRENVAQFAEYKSTIDLSDCAADARARVGGKSSFFEALIALCRLRQLPPIQHVRERVRALHKESVFRQLIPQVMVSATGRVLGRHNGLMGDEEALLWEMHHDVAVHQQIFARGGVLPAVELLQLEHGLRLEDFFYVSSRSPFVPRDRAMTFARGLFAGFYGDFSVAAHLLIPQIENSIRSLLEQAGAVTTTLTSTGLQNEKDLGALLADTKAVEIFGEAQVFDLRSLLTEKAGANLRNELAHGLSSDGAAEDHCAYAWWFALRLVLGPLIRSNPPISRRDPDASREGSKKHE